MSGQAEQKVVDLMAGLEDSVAQARARRISQSADRVERYLDAQAELTNLDHELLHIIHVADGWFDLRASDLRALIEAARNQ